MSTWLPPRRDADTMSVSSAVSAFRPQGRRQSLGFAPAQSSSGAASPRMAPLHGHIVPSLDSLGGASSYRVFVRIRPFLAHEVDPSDQSFPLPPIELRGSSECLFVDVATGMPRDVFHFDGCFCSITAKQWEQMSDLISLPRESLPAFPPTAQQDDIFQAVGTPIVDAVLDGFNASVLAYGQTSSGKTYTMMGTPQNEGLIPRIARAIMEGATNRVNEIADQLAASQGEGGLISLKSSANLGGALNGVISRDFSVEMSFFEIYNEAVLDLLQQGAAQHRRRKVRVHPVLGVYVEGLTYEKVSTWNHCLRLLQKGLQQRHTAATKMNEMSSRSHAIFQLRLVQTDMTDIGPVTRRSNVYLADLAGSERIKASAVEGDRLKEAAQINLSLTTLRRVIDALLQSTSAVTSASPSLSPSGGGGKMIPYRESMLTWVLSESLGGNAKACMVATLCPHPTYAEETYQTLQYAHRAKSIVNNVVKNEDQMAKSMRQLQDALRATLQSADGAIPQSPADAEAIARQSKHVKDQDALVASLREEQMLMLTKYADMKDAYDALKDELSSEVDQHEALRGKYTVLQQQSETHKHAASAMEARNQALEQQKQRLEEAVRRAALESEHLSQWKSRAEEERKFLEHEHRLLQSAHETLQQELQGAFARIDKLNEQLSAAMHKADQTLQQHAFMASRMQHWLQQALSIVWDSCFSSKRSALLSHVTSLSCEWAVEASSAMAALRTKVQRLEERLRDQEVVTASQDRALSHVASTYVDVREFLRKVDPSSSSAGGPPASELDATWTVTGILHSFHRFVAAARASQSVQLRVASSAEPVKPNAPTPRKSTSRASESSSRLAASKDRAGHTPPHRGVSAAPCEYSPIPRRPPSTIPSYK